MQPMKFVPNTANWDRWPPKLRNLHSRYLERGLDRVEWQQYMTILKTIDPQARQSMTDQINHQKDIEAARKLSIDELKGILAEKCS